MTHRQSPRKSTSVKPSQPVSCRPDPLGEALASLTVQMETLTNALVHQQGMVAEQQRMVARHQTHYVEEIVNARARDEYEARERHLEKLENKLANLQQTG